MKITKKDIEKAAKEYENKMYGYCIRKNVADTDCENMQNIIDVHEAFLAGVAWKTNQDKQLKK